MAAKVGPKIALIYDHDHNDPDELRITGKLMDVDQKNIVVFIENRFLEDPSKRQYSLELRSEDSMRSTATSCALLIANFLLNVEIQTGHVPAALSDLIKTIYRDSYFKKLFTEKHYGKYDPKNYGLERELVWKPLIAENLTEPQNKAIQYVNDLFHRLDVQLPQKKSFEEREITFRDQIDEARAALSDPTGPYDSRIFIPISHALAYIKIKQVHSKLDANADKSKELPLSMINQKMNLNELNVQYRTQFQVQKVIKIVEKILKGTPDTIFVVRNGEGHREMMTRQLKEHFPNGVIKEIQLKREEVFQAEKKIQAYFS